MNVKLTSDQLSVLLCGAIDATGLQSVLDELAMSARACGVSETTAMRIEDCLRGRSDIIPPSRRFLAATATEAELMAKKKAALAELNAKGSATLNAFDDVPPFDARPSAEIIAFSRPKTSV